MATLRKWMAVCTSVVGVILNLSIWFAIHVLFAQVETVGGYGLKLPVPVLASLNLPALILGAAAMLALLRFPVNLLLTLGVCAAAGLILKLWGIA